MPITRTKKPATPAAPKPTGVVPLKVSLVAALAADLVWSGNASNPPIQGQVMTLAAAISEIEGSFGSVCSDAVGRLQRDFTEYLRRLGAPSANELAVSNGDIDSQILETPEGQSELVRLNSKCTNSWLRSMARGYYNSGE